MTMTPQERAWLRTHLEARKTKLKQELSDLTATPADGKSATARAALEAHLQATGRAGETNTAAERDARAKAKEDHQADVLERVEEGINARRLEDQEARRVDAGTRLAAQEKPGAHFDAGSINAAKDAVAEQHARHDVILHAIETQITAKMATLYAGRARATLTLDEFHKVVAAATEAVADAKGLVMAGAQREAYLAHFASRHGSKTTLDDQIARPITGVPADFKDDTLPKDTVTLQDGTTAQVPRYAAFGNFDDVSSRLASGEAGLFMLEDSLIQAQELDRHGRSPDVFAVDLLTTAPKGFGEGVARVNTTVVGGMSNNQYNAYKTDASKTMPERFAARALGLKRDLDIKGAKVVLDRSLEGGYVPKTMFPDRRVENANKAQITTGPSTAPVVERAIQHERQHRQRQATVAQEVAQQAQITGGKRYATPKNADDARQALGALQKTLDTHIAAVTDELPRARLQDLARASADVKGLEAVQSAWNAALAKVDHAESQAKAALDTRNLAKTASDAALNNYKAANTPGNNATKIARQKDLLASELALETKFRQLQKVRAELEQLRPFVPDPANLTTQLDQLKLAMAKALTEAKDALGADLPVLAQVSAAAAAHQGQRLQEDGLGQVILDQALQANARKDAELRQKITAHAVDGAGQDEMQAYAWDTLELREATAAAAQIKAVEDRNGVLAAGRAALEKTLADRLKDLQTAQAAVQLAPEDIPKRKLLQEAQRQWAAADTALQRSDGQQVQLAEFLAAHAAPEQKDAVAQRLKQAQDKQRLSADKAKAALKPAKPDDPAPDGAAVLAEIDQAVEQAALADDALHRARAQVAGAQTRADLAQSDAEDAAAQVQLDQAILEKAKAKAVAAHVLTATATDDAVLAYMNDTLTGVDLSRLKDAAEADATASEVQKAKALRQRALEDAAKPQSGDAKGDAQARVEAVAKAQQKDIDNYRLLMQDDLADQAQRFQAHAEAADQQHAAADQAQQVVAALQKAVQDAQADAKDKKDLHASAALAHGERQKELAVLAASRQDHVLRDQEAGTRRDAAATALAQLKAAPSPAVQKIHDQAAEKATSARLAGEQADALELQVAEADRVASDKARQALADEAEVLAARQAADALAEAPGDAVEQRFAQARALEQQAAAQAAAQQRLEKDIMTAQGLASRATRDYEALRDKAGAPARLAAARQQLTAAEAELDTLDLGARDAKAKEIAGLRQSLQKHEQDAAREGDASAPALEALRTQVAQQEQAAQTKAAQFDAATQAARQAQASAAQARVDAEEARSAELEQARASLLQAQAQAKQAQDAADQARDDSERLADAITQARTQQTQDEAAAQLLEQQAGQAHAAELQQAQALAADTVQAATQAALALQDAIDQMDAKQLEVDQASQEAAEALDGSEAADLAAKKAATDSVEPLKQAEAEHRKQAKLAIEAERVRLRVQDEVADDKALAEAHLALAEAEHRKRVADQLKDPANALSVAQADLAKAQAEHAPLVIAAAAAHQLWHLAVHDQAARQVAHARAKALHDNAKAQVDLWVASGTPLTETQAGLQAHLPKLDKSMQVAKAQLDKADVDVADTLAGIAPAKAQVAASDLLVAAAVATVEKEEKKEKAAQAKGTA